MPLPQYEIIASYHEATKHHLHRYARSAGFMDWSNQPNPFRIYEDAAQIALPFCRQDPDLTFAELFAEPPATGSMLGLETVASFLEFSLGLSAWKRAGDNRWPLRINPSSGNLHPTEGYLIIPDVADLDGGLYHYCPLYHVLEQRAGMPDNVWARLTERFGGPGFLVALSTIFWRESWKYGERAFRYCNLDTGHALAAMACSAQLHDWHFRYLSTTADCQLRKLLGTDQTTWHVNEKEVPELICWVSPQSIVTESLGLPDEFVAHFGGQSFSGRPNALSQQPVDWPIIRRAAAAVEKETTYSDARAVVKSTLKVDVCEAISAADVIRKRRSAVRFDPHRFIEDRILYEILGRTLACQNKPPFDIGLGPPSIDLVLFVHRVEGLAPGLYLLVRRNQAIENLQAAWQADFLWRTVDCPVPLWQLISGDVCDEAATLSCHQDIAGHSAFAVAMLSPFEHLLRQAPYRYRHLHWECGMIGQALYLAAEAHGLRGTGIGCFFDDEVHRLLGIQDRSYQTLYHFTVGYAVEDDRLVTLPAYHHIDTAHRRSSKP
jgi:SagB-type dehydrogenase family enzyme